MILQLILLFVLAGAFGALLVFLHRSPRTHGTILDYYALPGQLFWTGFWAVAGMLTFIIGVIIFRPPLQVHNWREFFSKTDESSARPAVAEMPAVVAGPPAVAVQRPSAWEEAAYDRSQWTASGDDLIHQRLERCFLSVSTRAEGSDADFLSDPAAKKEAKEIGRVTYNIVTLFQGGRAAEVHYTPRVVDPTMRFLVSAGKEPGACIAAAEKAIAAYASKK